MTDIVGDSVPADNPGGNVDMENDNQAPEKRTDTVAWETHKRLLSQRKRDQEELKRLREFEAQQAEQKRLQEQEDQAKRGEFDKVLTAYKSENEELKQKLSARDEQELKHKKYQAVVDALPGRLANPQYVAFIDVNDVFVDPQTNLVDENSIKIAADKFVKEHSHLLVADKDIPRLPNETPKDRAPQPDGPKDFDEAKSTLREGFASLLPEIQGGG